MKMIHSLCFILLFSCSCILTAQQSGVRGGEYVFPQSGECLSEDHRQQIKHMLDGNIRMLREAGKLEKNPGRDAVLFDFPMQWNIPTDAYSFYAISNYVDHNLNYPDFIEDYNCGDRSYDRDNGYNHKGIDYYLWPFAWNQMEMDAVKIVAAADGVIIGKNEGNSDQSCGFNSNPWNAVYVQHSDGSTTWYGHMKKNSVTTRQVGESVVAGEYLGIVGSSGNSSGPHLHFEVYDADDDLVDPFSGPCNQWNDETLWNDQRPYIDPAILRIQTHFAPPEFHDCPLPADINDQNEFQPGDSIYFVTYFRDQQNWHPCEFSIRMPNGQIYDAWIFNSPHHFLSSSYWYWVYDLPSNVLQGTWTFQCEYLGKVYSHDFFVGEISSTEEKLEIIRKLTVKNDLQEITLNVDCNEGFEGKIFLMDVRANAAPAQMIRK